MNRNDLRKGMCENDTERTVARWLMESDGNWDNVSKSSGIPVDDLKTWVRYLSNRSRLREFLF